MLVVESSPNLGLTSAFCGSQFDDSPLTRERIRGVVETATTSGRRWVPAYCGASDVHDEPHLYARSSCSRTISREDCTACLEEAGARLMDRYCKDLYGAQVTLVDCFLRYETSRFC
ncbi:unnamed protein product [Linum tenue]|uniref:Gnk2-homologous domain-containing protein n=2 Tax=Linum tenue TaxID=586396 RepID=A0AAV0L2I0_9ROSI|nr:unnamed protein product [Linum tenue]